MKHVGKVSIITLLFVLVFSNSVFAMGTTDEATDGTSENAFGQVNQVITTSQERYGVAPSHKAFNLNAKAKTALSYKSSNPKVVTVSSKGKVTPKNAGDAYITITAKSTSKYNKATKTVHIDINNYKAVNGKMVSASSNKDNKPGDSGGAECRTCKYIHNKRLTATTGTSLSDALTLLSLTGLQLQFTT